MGFVFVLFLGVFFFFFVKSMVPNKKKKEEKWYLRTTVLKIKSHGLITLHTYLIIKLGRPWAMDIFRIEVK